ncbi:MAG TPA: enoyl-CoA hydratase-related protein [Trebonia sp.]|jgi:enoyl-CoA hydratase/carnithine racemase|nr:enoyl-CoA hydratase-related protein [Trebonia sp.]
MTAADAGLVRFVVDGSVARLILNRPDKRNAVSPEVATGLEAALERLESTQELRVGVVSGAGAAFCAGADLGYVARGEAARLSTRRGGFAGFVRYPRRKPLIAAVHGYALAGGFEIALACDLIVAEHGAVFGLPEVTRGLIANGGGVLRLASALPRARALELILTGRRLDATEAAGLGLITRVVPVGEALTAALDLAAEIASHPAAVVQESLYLANAAARLPAEELWTLCAEIAGRLRGGADAREGAAAFLERREASWNSQQ